MTATPFSMVTVEGKDTPVGGVSGSGSGDGSGLGDGFGCGDGSGFGDGSGAGEVPGLVDGSVPSPTTKFSVFVTRGWPG